MEPSSSENELSTSVDTRKEIDDGVEEGTATPQTIATSSSKRKENGEAALGRYAALSPNEEPFQDEDREENPAHSEVPAFLSRVVPRSILSSGRFRKCYRWSTTNFISDGSYRLRGLPLLDGVESMRLTKFTFWSIALILIVHPFIRWVGWENDANFTLHDFFLYDFHHVLLDIVVFFFVGRLYKRRGVDSFFPYLIPMFAGSIYPSMLTDVWFLRHSASMYEIVCHWPWQLFAFVFVNIAVVSMVVFLHVKGVMEEGRLVISLLELTAILGLFLLPNVSHPNFHLHHWYFSWLIGMHFNLDAWWSKLTMAFVWGQYLNGIAVYGRDPILTCAYSYYISTDIHCKYMKCNALPSNHTGGGGGGGGYKPLVTPNWHNCSATGNYSP